MPLEKIVFYKAPEDNAHYRLERYTHTHSALGGRITKWWKLCRWSDIGKKWVQYIYRDEQLEELLKNLTGMDEISTPDKESTHIEFGKNNDESLIRIQPERHQVMIWNGNNWQYIGPRYSIEIRLGNHIPVSELEAAKILKDSSLSRRGIELTDEEANRKLFLDPNVKHPIGCF